MKLSWGKETEEYKSEESRIVNSHTGQDRYT